MPGRSLLDIGFGMGISTITFAEMGARVTFAESSPTIWSLYAGSAGLRAKFLWIERFEDIDRLPGDFDVVTALGSLINAPLAVTRSEIAHQAASSPWRALAALRLSQSALGARNIETKGSFRRSFQHGYCGSRARCEIAFTDGPLRRALGD